MLKVFGANYIKGFSQISKKRVLPKVVASTALVLAPLTVTNCTKLDKACLEEFEEFDFNKSLNLALTTVGVLKNNDVESLKNLIFSDTNENIYILEKKSYSNTEFKLNFTKADKNHKLLDSSELRFTKDDEFLRLDIIKGDKIVDTKKYLSKENKVIELGFQDGLYTPQAEFKKTEKGFVKNSLNNVSIEYKNIRNNDFTPIFIYDDSYNEIVHEIVI